MVEREGGGPRPWWGEEAAADGARPWWVDEAVGRAGGATMEWGAMGERVKV